MEDVVEPFLQKETPGAICVSGPAGSGRSTALAHLGAGLPQGRVVAFLDDPDACQVTELCDHLLVIYSAREPLAIPHLAQCALAPWGEDECLEYLMAAHRARCASVMRRIRFALAKDIFPENPELWRICLDRMAADESVGDFDTALRRRLDRELGRGWRRRAAGACLKRIVGPEGATTGEMMIEGPSGCLGLLMGSRPSSEALRLLRYRRLQILLAAEEIVRGLRRGKAVPALKSRLVYELVLRAGRVAAGDRKALANLESRLVTFPEMRPMGASILHAAGTGWRPDGAACVELHGGYFPNAGWQGLQLPKARLDDADLTGANLGGAILDEAVLDRAWLWQANLRNASLQGISARKANLSGADLTHVTALGANFTGADLSKSVLESALLRDGRFMSADLRGANLRQANLKGASFFEAQLAGADFSRADLEGCHLRGLDLTEAVFEGVRLVCANLQECNLEGLHLPGCQLRDANLRNATLTGTSMPEACLRGAILYAARLADVEWERADLREADLRGANFHLGSSRSGLVFGGPSEGTRTGFYTDEFYDQSYRAPEEIRRANLCGADLRGARVEETDFYLVDLRGARFTPEQERHFRRCGAILEARV